CHAHPAVHSFPTRRSSDLIVVTLITLPGLWRRSANVRKGDLGEVAGATKWKGSDVIGKYRSRANCPVRRARSIAVPRDVAKKYRSEEHTSELQSRENLVCR